MAVGPRLSSETYSVVTRRGDRALSQEVRRIVEDLRASGELDRLTAKWF
jgi:ABC-type amino acid transport substrate-binding protein